MTPIHELLNRVRWDPERVGIGELVSVAERQRYSARASFVASAAPAAE